MRFLVTKTPDSFIKSVNDDICSILNRHFENLYPQYSKYSYPECDFEQDMDKLSIPVELIEKENEYEVKAQLPGVKKEDLDIEVEKNYITICAKKEEEQHEDKKSYKKTEFQYGEFSRSVYLPNEVDSEKAQAEFKDGILTIKVQKINKNKESAKKLIIK